MDAIKDFLAHPIPALRLTLTSYLVAITSLIASLSARAATMLDTAYIASHHISPDHDSWGIPAFLTLIAYAFIIIVCTTVSGILAYCIKAKHVTVNLYAGLPHKHQNDIVSTFEALIWVAYALCALVFWTPYTYVNPLVTILDIASYIGYTYYVMSVLALSGAAYIRFTNWLQWRRRA